MIGFIELIRASGFAADVRQVKLVRHKGDDLDMDQLRNEGWFETYQCFQSKPVFDGCTHIVSVIGEDATASRFVGIYEVQGSTTASPALLPEHCPYTQWGTESRVFYTLKKCPGFEDLEDRVVIDWGKGALAWHQWLTDRTIMEIRPRAMLNK